MNGILAATCAALLLAACSGGSPAAAPQSVAEALAVGESSGALPKLDRSNSVAGPDADGNGVRDDIDAYIASLPDTPEQKAALKQESKAIRATLLIDSSNDSEVVAAIAGISKSSNCLSQWYDAQTVSQKGDDMEKLTVNTKARFAAYMAFNHASSGHVSLLPQGNTCENQ